MTQNAPASQPLRIGILGAARIANLSIAGPSRATGDHLVAMASRDRKRAEVFALEHGVARVLDSYRDVVTDPEVEVVYNPLVNIQHGPWNLAAIGAGKHVLTEKPSASNSEEAAEVRDAAIKAGVVVMEAFHYRFHPVTQRLYELLDSGELGTLRRVETLVAITTPPVGDPRWSLSLAGGALMDLGCYGLHAQRMFAPWAGGPPRLIAARGGERPGTPEVDEWMAADLAFPGGATGSARCHMAYGSRVMTCRVVGTRGEATAMNFIRPHLDDRVVVKTPSGGRIEELGRRPSYIYQLEAFAAHVRLSAPLPIDANDALTTMLLIDDCYRAAGFRPRPRSPRE
jgi:predicted dehydrogenase